MDSTDTNDDDFISNVQLIDNLNIHYPNSNDTFSNTKINLLHININSIRNKIDDLLLYILQFEVTIHVVCISEMRLSSDELNICNLPNYDAVCCPRSSRSGGGACIFIHKSIEYETIRIEEFCEGSAIILSLKEPNIKVSVIYRPPHAPFRESIEYLDSIFESNRRMLCVGDFNINLLSTNSQQYLSMLESNGFTCLNRIHRNYTTYGHGDVVSILDHAVTDLCNHTFSMSLDDVSFTDHKSILISFGSSNRITVNRGLSRCVRLDFDRISIDLQQTLEGVESFESLTEIITNSMNCNSYELRSSNRINNRAPWINENVLREIRLRDQLYRRTIQWPENDIIKCNYKRQKNYVTKLIKHKKKLCYHNLIAENRNNIRKVWNILNEIIYGGNSCDRRKGITEIVSNNITLKTNWIYVMLSTNTLLVNQINCTIIYLWHSIMKQKNLL